MLTTAKNKAQHFVWWVHPCNAWLPGLQASFTLEKERAWSRAWDASSDTSPWLAAYRPQLSDSVPLQGELGSSGFAWETMDFCIR